MSENNRRKAFRSDFELGKFLKLRFEGKELNGLLLEESNGGFSCIVVGDHDIKTGQSLEWIESDSWLNVCKVIRKKSLKPNVKLICVAFEDE